MLSFLENPPPENREGKMNKYKEKNITRQGIEPCNNLETHPPNTLLVPPSLTLFLLVNSPGMLSTIILHSFGRETFLWF